MTAQVERTLQSECMLRLRAGGWPVLALPIPNSVYFPARNEAERNIIARVVSQMKTAGQLVSGAPDLVVLWRGGGALIELKRPKTKTLFGTLPAGRSSPEQIEMAERAALVGVPYSTAHSWEDMRDRLRAWGAPL